MLVAMLGPPLRDPPRDSYPLSTYPMFSTDRGRLSSIATAVGTTIRGEEVRLSPELIGGGDEPMLAVQTAADAVRAGPAGSLELCEQVARRVAGSDLTEVVEIVVRTEVRDNVAWFADGERRPVEIVEAARCEVDD